jgi:hypothetical protein
METSESGIGYPEQQPSEVDDTPVKGTPQRPDKEPGTKSGNDDGTATGNRDNAG